MLNVNYVKKQAYFRKYFVFVRKLTIVGKLVWTRIYSIRLIVLSCKKGIMIPNISSLKRKRGHFMELLD
jgi:hypothetical protein